MTDSLHTEVAAAATARTDATRRGDLAALADLLHDDLHYIHSSARVDGKQSHIDSIGSGQITYPGFTPTELRFITLNEGAVIRTGVMEIAVTVGGVDKVLDNRFIETWVRSGPGWRMASWQSTPRPRA